MRSTTLKFGLPSPTYTYVRLFLTMLCLGLVVTACEPDEADQPEHPIHPVSEFIPYYDNDHVVVDGGPSVDALVDVPQPIRLLSDYLDDPESVDARELQTFVSESPWEFRVRAIDKHRLIMVALLHYAELERRMEEYDARLVEYDLRTDAYVNHADEEPDIGHLEQITDIKLRDAALSVAHMPQEISHFDCTSAPCVCATVQGRFARGKSSCPQEHSYLSPIQRSQFFPRAPSRGAYPSLNITRTLLRSSMRSTTR